MYLRGSCLPSHMKWIFYNIWLQSQQTYLCYFVLFTAKRFTSETLSFHLSFFVLSRKWTKYTWDIPSKICKLNQPGLSSLVFFFKKLSTKKGQLHMFPALNNFILLKSLGSSHKIRKIPPASTYSIVYMCCQWTKFVTLVLCFSVLIFLSKVQQSSRFFWHVENRKQ